MSRLVWRQLRVAYTKQSLPYGNLSFSRALRFTGQAGQLLPDVRKVKLRVN